MAIYIFAGIGLIAVCGFLLLAIWIALQAGDDMKYFKRWMK